jgi:hypothetical protein
LEQRATVYGNGSAQRSAITTTTITTTNTFMSREDLLRFVLVLVLVLLVLGARY